MVYNSLDAKIVRLLNWSIDKLINGLDSLGSLDVLAGLKFFDHYIDYNLRYTRSKFGPEGANYLNIGWSPMKKF